ncbi:MAG TPA: zf-HC2 domain-containing protein [Planctomycetota bacterium]|jgi:hypothetical protein|nr:zf-HC2 domain-containing protein [Planctomycetota bacterium]
MNCEEARPRFDDRIDGSLGTEDLLEVDEHVARCGGCRFALADLEAALERLRDLPPLRTPDSFEEQVLARVRAERAPALRPLLPYAAALAALAGTWLATSGFFRGAIVPIRGDDLRVAGAAPPAPPLEERRRPAPPVPPSPLPEIGERGRAPEIDWAEAARQGIRFLAAASDLMARAARDAASEAPPPVPASLVREEPPAAAPAVAEEPARPRSEGRGEAPLFPAEEPAGSGGAVVVQRGNETVLFSSGPPEKEIPALLALLRDRGGKGADLALSRLVLLERELSSRGVVAGGPALEGPSLLGRVRSFFSRSAESDERSRSLEGWERWWSENRPAILRVAAAEPAWSAP